MNARLWLTTFVVLSVALSNNRLVAQNQQEQPVNQTDASSSADQSAAADNSAGQAAESAAQPASSNASGQQSASDNPSEPAASSASQTPQQSDDVNTADQSSSNIGTNQQQTTQPAPSDATLGTDTNRTSVQTTTEQPNASQPGQAPTATQPGAPTTTERQAQPLPGQQRNQRDRTMVEQGTDVNVTQQRQSQFDTRIGQDQILRDNRIGIRFGQFTDRGLIINTIEPGSVFFRSGLRNGDVVVSLFGRPIRSDAEFVRLINLYPDERIPVVVLRDGRQQTLYVTYSQDISPTYRAYRGAMPPGSAPVYLGVLFNTTYSDGAFVSSVTPGSPAEQAGLRGGDIIVAINGSDIRTYQDAIRMIRSMRAGDRIDIDFSRRADNRTQAVLAGGSGDSVRTATRAPDEIIEQQTAPVPGRVYEEQVMPEDSGPRPLLDRDRVFEGRLRDRPARP